MRGRGRGRDRDSRETERQRPHPALMVGSTLTSDVGVWQYLQLSLLVVLMPAYHIATIKGPDRPRLSWHIYQCGAESGARTSGPDALHQPRRICLHASEAWDEGLEWESYQFGRTVFSKSAGIEH